MKPATIVSIVAVVALMVGTLALYATGALLDDGNPDPHDYEMDYTVTGEYQSQACTGTASIDRLHENESFYNYLISVKVTLADASIKECSFVVIFDEREKPFHMSFSETEEHAGEMCIRYAGNLDGKDVSILVGDNCRIYSFAYDDGTWDIQGNDSEVA